jgi:hypothetical protein
MTDSFTYWRPQPRRRSFMWWALLLPACVYSLGVIVYAHAAFAPDAIAANGHAWGSALMVVGGESGTLAAASEVFRKSQTEPPETNLLDWMGLLVSLVATLGNLFVVYSVLTRLQDGWVALARSYGPLALLLFSGLDFYAAVMEFGFYNASFEARMEAWRLAQHNAELRWKRRSDAEAETESADDARSDAEPQGGDADLMRNDAQPDAGETQPEALRCPYCGTTATKSGEPFNSQQGVAAHMRYCDAKEGES